MTNPLMPPPEIAARLQPRADGYRYDPQLRVMWPPPATESPVDPAAEVELSPDEWRKSAHFAIDRRADSLASNAHNAVGNKRITTEVEICQVCAVNAGARALRVPPTLNRGTFQPDRVGDLLVRHSTNAKARLRVYDKDPDHLNVILMIGRGRRYRIAGWMPVAEAKRVGKSEDLTKSGVRVWVVAQASLRPVATLVEAMRGGR